MSPAPPAEVGELEAFRSLLDGAPGAHLREIGGGLCTAFDATPSSALLNRGLGLGLARPADDDVLDEAASFFDDLGVAYAVTVTPETAPGDLGERLEERGFVGSYAWTKFERAAGPAAPSPRSELRVEEIGADRAGAFADVFVRAYGAPPLLAPLLCRLPGLDGWTCFVAFAGEVPAAAAALHVAGPVGWLGIAGTLPELRGRGAQTALLNARIEAAAARGCSVVVTETGEPRDGRPGASYRNIVRAGFEAVYVRQNYLSDATADTSDTDA